MKNLLLIIALICMGSTAWAGECANGVCSVRRSRAVNVTREIVNVPVQITKRTVNTVRNVGQRTVNRVRNITR